MGSMPQRLVNGVTRAVLVVASLTMMGREDRAIAQEPNPTTRAQAAVPIRHPAAAPQLPANEHTPQLVAESRSRQLCESVPGRVFVPYDLGSECIAYYATTGALRQRPAVFYFEGDVAASELRKATYSASYLDEMRSVFQQLTDQTGVRLVFVARPGLFGSSGNHSARRSVGEMLAMNGAVDAIKARLGIDHIVLAGQSGGSTISAALLTLGRRDIACAVLGSGLLSVVEIEHAHRLSERLPEIKRELMHVYLFDPTDRLAWIETQASRRVFVLGDPADRRTPYRQQRAFAEELRSHGHHAVAIEVAGQGEMAHGVAHHTLPAAAQCARGASDTAIRLQVAAKSRPAPAASKPQTQTSQLGSR